MAKSLAAIPGVATAAPQRIVLSQIDEHPANLIAFDPAIDFSILPWLGEHLPGPLTADHVIAGGRVKVRVGDALRLCGKPFVVHGRLEQTGVGPFDQSYFLSLEALAALSAIIRKSGVQNGQSPAASANAADGLAAPDPVDRLKAGETNACGADISVDRVSAFLLRLSPDAKLQDVKFAIAQLPGVRIVEGNSPPRAKR
jgi:putative ABC transport system permease protein